MNPGVYGPLDSATNLYTGLPISKQRVSSEQIETMRADDGADGKCTMQNKLGKNVVGRQSFKDKFSTNRF